MGATIQAIPNPNVQWQDALGAAQLTVTSPKFDSWNPTAQPIGSKRVNLATGFTYYFVERIDYTATFRMSAIPPSSMPLMQRLKLWLETGGQVTINTQDAVLASYTCAIAPGGDISWQWDAPNQWFTLSMAVKNTLQQPMTCLYTTQVGAGYILAVTPTSISAQAPNTAQLTATLSDPAGNPVTGVPITWQTSNPNIALVGITTGLVTPVAVGQCTVYAVAGGLTVGVPVTVTASTAAASIALSPTPTLAFTQTTYTGTPTVGVSGVPAQLVTATIRNSQGQALPYTSGALVWSVSDNTAAAIINQENGTCSVQPLRASIGVLLTCKLAANPSITQSIAVTSVAAPAVASCYLVSSIPAITFTAAGQTSNPTVTTINQYGVTVP